MIEKDAETDRKKAVIEAEKEAQVAKIRFLVEIYSSSGKVLLIVVSVRYEQNILEKESMATMEKITDSIHLAKEHTRTDAEFYKVTWQSNWSSGNDNFPVPRFKSKQKQIGCC